VADAAGAVLDAAALMDSTIDMPRDAQSNLTIRAGYITLRRICDFFRVPYDPIRRTTRSASRVEIRRTRTISLPRRAAGSNRRAQAWRDFAGWRVNYDVRCWRCAG